MAEITICNGLIQHDRNTIKCVIVTIAVHNVMQHHCCWQYHAFMQMLALHELATTTLLTCVPRTLTTYDIDVLCDQLATPCNL